LIIEKTLGALPSNNRRVSLTTFFFLSKSYRWGKFFILLWCGASGFFRVNRGLACSKASLRGRFHLGE
jgi:hypothetical protein